jgi:integrase
VEKPKPRVNPTLLFSPADLREIFAALVDHRPDLLPAVAIAAFCGLRTAEIQRIDWREVRLAQGCVEVPAIKSKTASRRVVPLCDAARSWLVEVAFGTTSGEGSREVVLSFGGRHRGQQPDENLRPPLRASNC